MDADPPTPEKILVPEMRLVRDVGNVQAYDAVVVGSPLYDGRWLPEATQFLNQHGAVLSRRPLWLFSSGPIEEVKSPTEFSPVPDVQHALMRLDARGHATFGGCLQADTEYWTVQQIIRDRRRNDFRDFRQIDDWAREIGTELTGGTVVPSLDLPPDPPTDPAAKLPGDHPRPRPPDSFGAPRRWRLRRPFQGFQRWIGAAGGA